MPIWLLLRLFGFSNRSLGFLLFAFYFDIGYVNRSFNNFLFGLRCRGCDGGFHSGVDFALIPFLKDVKYFARDATYRCGWRSKWCGFPAQ